MGEGRSGGGRVWAAELVLAVRSVLPPMVLCVGLSHAWGCPRYTPAGAWSPGQVLLCSPHLQCQILSLPCHAGQPGSSCPSAQDSGSSSWKELQLLAPEPCAVRQELPNWSCSPPAWNSVVWCSVAGAASSRLFPVQLRLARWCSAPPEKEDIL